MTLALQLGCLRIEIEVNAWRSTPGRFEVLPHHRRYRVQRRILRKLHACIHSAERRQS